MVDANERRRVLVAVVVALLLAAACASDDSTADAEPACEDGTLEGRGFILCTAGDTGDQGLVVALHGRGSSAQEMQTVTRLDREAAEAGLAVVYPDAVDGGWGDDTFTGDEDVVFLDHLIEELRSDERIDDRPVGVVGFSNGASMALRYGVERSDDVRAVVSVAGQLPRDAAIRPSQPVSLLEIYGTGDPIRGYDTGIPDTGDRQPGQPTPTLPTAESVAAFVALLDSPEHQAPEESDPAPSDGTRLRTERWVGTDGTVVVLHSVVDGGHTWPSATTPFAGAATFGPISRDLDATAAAITFLQDPQ